MGTRGLMGLVIDGEVKATYNHYDSYPSGLGEEILKLVRSGGISKAAAVHLEVVDADAEATPEQIAKYSKYADTGVSSGELTEWYVLLRHLQGDLEGYLEAGVMADGSAFATDSLFCEWGYLINLDDNTLEVYKGFNKIGDPIKGRFAVGAPTEPQVSETGYTNEYSHITEIAKIPFTELDDYTMTRIDIAQEIPYFTEEISKIDDVPDMAVEYIDYLEESLRSFGVQVPD